MEMDKITSVDAWMSKGIFCAIKDSNFVKNEVSFDGRVAEFSSLANFHDEKVKPKAKKF